MRTICSVCLFFMTSAAWSFSFDDLGVDVGVSGRYASFTHEEGSLPYALADQYSAAVTYSAGRAWKYGFEFGYSQHQYTAKDSFIGESQSLFSMSLYATHRLPISRNSNVWLGAGIASHLRSHTDRYSVTSDGYIDERFNDIEFGYSNMVGQLRAEYEFSNVLDVPLPLGAGFFCVLEKGFSERTGAASIGIKLIL